MDDQVRCECSDIRRIFLSVGREGIGVAIPFVADLDQRESTTILNLPSGSFVGATRERHSGKGLGYEATDMRHHVGNRPSGACSDRDYCLLSCEFVELGRYLGSEPLVAHGRGSNIKGHRPKLLAEPHICQAGLETRRRSVVASESCPHDYTGRCPPFHPMLSTLFIALNPGTHRG